MNHGEMLLTSHGEQVGVVAGLVVRVVLDGDVLVQRVGDRASEYRGEHVQRHRIADIRNLQKEISDAVYGHTFKATQIIAILDEIII